MNQKTQKRKSKGLRNLVAIGFCLLIAGFGLFLLLREKPPEFQPPPPEPREATELTLTYNAGDNGIVEGERKQMVLYGGSGNPVTAVPEEGYHFVTWSDGVNTAERTDSNLTNDLTVTAEFALNQYEVKYIAGQGGNIIGEASQSVGHGADAEPVTAEPLENHTFVTWSDGLTTAERTDRSVSQDLSLTANFAIKQYTLKYVAGPNGLIKGEAVQTVDRGGNGSAVTATPKEGYFFVAWSDGVETPIRIDRNVTNDVMASALFAPKQYTLKYSAGKHGRIQGELNQTVNHGENGSAVEAIPDQDYHFVTWSDGVTTARRIDNNVTADKSISAEFAVNTYSVGGHVSGLMKGTPLVLQINKKDDLKLADDGSFTFSAELLNGEGYEVAVLKQPMSPNLVCSVDNGIGTISSADVTDVLVTCIPRTYVIGGTVTGLPDGEEVVLQNNAGDDLAIKANGPFAFSASLDDGSRYDVTVAKQPRKKNWECAVENGAGELSGNDVRDIAVSCYVIPVLEAQPGIRKFDISWNQQDFDKVTFNLCQAREDIALQEGVDCQKLQDGVWAQKVDSPQMVTGVTSDVPYWFQLEVVYSDGRKVFSDVVSEMAIGGLNDSGIDWCADSFKNYEIDGTRAEKSESCHVLAGTHPGQDGHDGRDALARTRKLDKEGHGSAGFDFTKICRSGQAAGEGKCPPNPSAGLGLNNWACTRDNVTGLTWEVKTDTGVQAYFHTFSWYGTKKDVNGGKPGIQNGGRCEGGNCDTQSYINKINDMGLCGIKNWRLPTRKELFSIVDNSRTKPAVNLRYFPNTAPAYYWSSSPYADSANSAWQVYFLYGEASPDEKTQAKNVRLVTGKTRTFGLDNP